MKTNIILKIENQEQLDKVQEIVFANGGKWFKNGTKRQRIESLFIGKYIEIDEEKDINRIFKSNSLIDSDTLCADLFIRTNGTCEEQEPKTSKYPHFEKMLNNMNENFAEAIKMVEENEEKELENAKYKLGDFLKGKSGEYKGFYIEIEDTHNCLAGTGFFYTVKNASNEEHYSLSEKHLDNHFELQKFENEPIKTETLEEDKNEAFFKKFRQNNATNPNHYNQMKIQPNEYITANQNCFSWYTANVIKYVSRYKSKNGIEDLEKAIKYLQFEIEELKKAEQC